jgi:hypothetical protein
MQTDFDIAARRLYAASADVAPWPPWEGLSEPIKERYRYRAQVVAACTPAPVVVRLKHVPPFPHTGIELHIYADATKAGIDEAVEQFRRYITDLAEQWSFKHEETQR